MIGSKGLVAQSMDARKPAADQVQPYNFPSGSHAWSPPQAGFWKFVGWGPGGNAFAASTGGSGGYFEITRFLRTPDVVQIVAGPQFSPGNTTVSFPDGTIATATFANGATAGVATGGDVNLAGTVGGLAGFSNGNPGLGTGGGAGGTTSGALAGGSGAPANSPYKGGKGGNASGAGFGATPGGGAAETAGNLWGGAGLVIATLVRQ